jgi:hypothetical protein
MASPADVSSGPGRDSPAELRACARVFFGFASPRILAAILLLATALRLALAAWSWWDLAIAAAIALYWPVQEWLIHVLILHWRPRRVAGRMLDFRTPQKHRAHHRDPWQLDLVLIPLHVYAYAPVAIVGLWLLLAPTPAAALTGVVVHFALALHYEWVHFLVHTRYRPRSARYEKLWRNHRLHHFKNEHYWYGVTMLSGDRLFGTAPERDAVPTSPTARTLGLETSLGEARLG